MYLANVHLADVMIVEIIILTDINIGVLLTFS